MLCPVPACCNGSTAYNDDSGCGKSEAIDYCEGGEFDPDHVIEFECRSPVESVDNPDYDHTIEYCHTEECKKSAVGCIAARGKEVEHHPGKIYSMQLAPREIKCSERAPPTCHIALDASTHKACTYLDEEGEKRPCLDANCHKSEEECLSRADTAIPFHHFHGHVQFIHWI